MEALSIILAIGALVAVVLNKTAIGTLTQKVARLEGELAHLKATVATAGAQPRPARNVAPAAVRAEAQTAAPDDFTYCPECGAQNSLVAHFCAECGSRLSSSETQPVEPAVAYRPLWLEEQQVPERHPVLAPLLRKARSTEEWEALIGGRWMNRIGAVALILGIGLFFKYAVDQNWISEGLRVGIGMLVGAVLLTGAWRSHRRGYAIFAQGLVGAGIGVLYLSVYASFQLYHLVPGGVALTAMAGVTALALIQALYYDSLVVALLAWMGGFLTIPLLGISNVDELGLVGYIVLLDVGLLGIVFAKDPWFVLEPLTMGATYASFLGWYLASYHAGKLGLAAASLTVFWALFYALDVSRLLRRIPTQRDLRDGLGVANACFYYGGMTALLYDHREWLGLMTLAMGSVYIATILLAKRSLHGDDRVDARYTLTALVLAAVATPILLTGFTAAILWSLEAPALLWCGVRWKLWYVWRPALLLFGIVSAFLLATKSALVYAPIADFTPLLNERFLAFAALAAALGGGALVLKRLDDRYRDTYIALLHYAWFGAIFTLLTVETNDAFRHAMIGAGPATVSHLQLERWLVLAAVWMAYSFPLVWLGLRSRILPMLTSGLAAAGLAILAGMAAGAVYQPIEQFRLLLNVRAGILAFLIAALVVHVNLLRRGGEGQSWVDLIAGGCWALAGLMGFELLTAEIHDFFRQQSGALSEGTGRGLFVELVVLAAAWMLYSFPLVHAGLQKRALPILGIGMGAGVAAAGAGAAAALAFQSTRWLSLSLSRRPAILLFAIGGFFLYLRWLRKSSVSYPWLTRVLVALQACIVLLGFELVSTETRDVFRYQIAQAQARSVAADVDRWRNLEQLTLSIVWLLYAIVLMVFGLWRRTRWLRLGAMALFGFIILKIFIYDLSFLSPAYRSISFAGLGIILIGVSYLYQRYRRLLLDAA